MYIRAILGLIVIVLGGASWFLAAFYPRQTIKRIQADKTIKDSRRLIRFLRRKLALNGTLMVLLGILLWSRWAPDYAIGVVALVLLGFSFYSERLIKSRAKG